MDPLSAIVLFLGALTIMGAAILALIAKLTTQVAAIIAAQQASIDANTATQIQTGLQGISDSLTSAGFPGQ